MRCFSSTENLTHFRNSYPIIQNLTRCTKFNWKSDQRKKFHFKVWHVVKLIPQNLTGFILFNSKSDAMSFSSVENLTCWEVFNSESDQMKNVDFKIRCVVKLFFQNLMRCFPWNQHLTRCIFFSKFDLSEGYNSKSKALSFLYSKSDTLKLSSFPNLTPCKILTQNLTRFFFKNRRVVLFSFIYWLVEKYYFQNLMCFFKYKIWHLVKVSSQNLSRCSFFFGIRQVVFLSVQNLTCS